MTATVSGSLVMYDKMWFNIPFEFSMRKKYRTVYWSAIKEILANGKTDKDTAKKLASIMYSGENLYSGDRKIYNEYMLFYREFVLKNMGQTDPAYAAMAYAKTAMVAQDLQVLHSSIKYKFSKLMEDFNDRFKK